MATLNTAQYLLQAPTSGAAGTAPSDTSGGGVRFAAVRYVLSGSEAANDTINVAILPEGAIPLPCLSSIDTLADPGTTLTFDVGNTADPDGWGDGIACQTNPHNPMTSSVSAFSDPTPLPKDDATIVAKVTAAASLTADVVIIFNLAYKMGS